MKKSIFNDFIFRRLIMTIGTDVVGIKADIATIKAALATPTPATVDLTPVLTAQAATDAKVTDIQASLVVPA